MRALLGLPLALIAIVSCGNAGPEAELGQSALPIQVSSEVQLDTGIQGPAPGDYSLPRAAVGAGVQFVIWPDDNKRILGVRLDATGKALDPNPIVLVDGPQQLDTPYIGFGGQTFLLSWLDTPGAGSFWNGHIRVSRVSPEGKLLDPGGIALTAASGDNAWPAIVYDGTNFLVVWIENKGTGASDRVVGRRVTTAGTPIESAPVELGTLSYGAGWPAVAFNGQHHLVAWNTYDSNSIDSIRFRRFTPDLTPLDASDKILVAGASSVDYIGNPVASSDGSSWLVGWNRNGVEVAKVDANGNAGAIQPKNAALFYPYSISYGAGSYLINGTTGLSPNAMTAVQLMDANGGAIGSVLSVAPKKNNGDFAGDIIFSGTEFLATYSTGGFDNGLVRATRVTTAGAKAGEILLSQSLNEETFPELAFDGTRYLAVWADSRGEGSDVYGMLVDDSGQPTTAQAFPIASGAGNQTFPSVAWDGNVFVVVWNDDKAGHFDIRAARVSSSGTLLDAASKVVSAEVGHQLGPRIASSGDGKSYVVWEDHRTSGFLKIYGARLSGADSQDGGGVSIASDIRDRYLPSITFGGGVYLVVWSDERNLQTDENVFAARIGADGTLLDPSGIELSAEAGIEHSPRTSFDGTSFVVVWRRFVDGGLFMRRVDTQGKPLGAAQELSLALDAQTPAAMAFDGTNAIVAFEAQGELRGSSVAGASVDPFSIAPAASKAQRPSVASDSNGRALIAYSRPDPASGALRVAARLITADGAAGAGGASGSGGAAGSSASGGSGALGSGGTGGAGAQGGMAGASTGGANAQPGSGGDGGCGCQVPGSRTSSSSAILALGLLLMRRLRRSR